MKNMQKMAAYLTALTVMLLALCAGAAAEPADVTGDWYTSLYGMTMTVTLNEGGVYVMRMGEEDEEEEGTWALDGETLILDKGTEAEMALAYDAEANSFSVADEDIELLLTREMPEVFEAAPARTDSALEEFTGTWTCELVGMMGMQAPPDLIGLDMTLRIDGNMVSLSITDMVDMGDLALAADFADGVLTLTIASESEYTEDTVIAMQLLEDGMLTASMAFLDESIVFYMTPAEGQE